MVVTGFIEGRYELLADADVYIGPVTDVLLSSNRMSLASGTSESSYEEGPET
jgi:hypothetical protein